MNPKLKPIRWLIFLYFLLLISEGALRFWVFPQYSNWLLVVRDPVVILIYFMAIGAGVFPFNGAVSIALPLAIVTGLSSLVMGNVPLLVTVFGLRANFLHLPLAYVMFRVLSGKDVLWLGRWMMLLMIPMAFLVVKQFRSPPGSFINLGGMPTWWGTVRPAGTFSFVSGMVCFSALVAAFVADSFAHARTRKGWVLRILSALAVLASMAVSGSRSTILAVGIVFVLLITLSLTSRRTIPHVLVFLGVIGLGAAGLSSTEFFEEGQRQLAKRFEETAQATGKGAIEGGIERWADMFIMMFYVACEAPLFGNGQGMGTNAAYWVISEGQRGFGGGGETEVGRIMYEMGAVFGTIFLLLRLGIMLDMLKHALRALRGGSMLPMLLFGAAGLNMWIGAWGIPTTQGFACFGAGLCLASVKVGLVRRIRFPTPLVERDRELGMA